MGIKEKTSLVTTAFVGIINIVSSKSYINDDMTFVGTALITEGLEYSFYGIYSVHMDIAGFYYGVWENGDYAATEELEAARFILSGLEIKPHPNNWFEYLGQKEVITALEDLGNMVIGCFKNSKFSDSRIAMRDLNSRADIFLNYLKEIKIQHIDHVEQFNNYLSVEHSVKAVLNGVHKAVSEYAIFRS